MDTILWKKESDAYTNRAVEKFGINNLYDLESEWALNFKQIILKYIREPQSICEIGCGFGAVIHGLKELFPTTNFVGIDPGKESIEIAREREREENIVFKIGYSHSIDVAENSIDVVILRMVLQWIPRNKMFKTISEIDRILKTGGVVWLQDFLPNRPITSISRHNSDVRIFKEEYNNYFTSAPWYKEIFRQTDMITDGEDYQRYISIVMKYKLADVYLEKAGVIEKSM